MNYARWLEARRIAHDRASSADSRGQIRRRVRERAREVGLPPPAWARVQGDEPQADARPAVSVSIPPELHAWRERTPGSAVHAHQGGVTIHAMGEPARTFGTAAEAIVAIGAIK